MLDIIERWVVWLGAAMVAATLGAIGVGLVQAQRRPRGRATGMAHKALRPVIYVLIGVPFFALCVFLWRPLPLTLSSSIRSVALALGVLLYFPGLFLVLWARLTLGKMYNVSMSVGAQLYADHRLVTRGPFAVVRHPMYLGIMIASLGGLMIYRTWTTVFTLIFLGLAVRARREEQALAAEFGDEWEAYCRRVPRWLPRVQNLLGVDMPRVVVEIQVLEHGEGLPLPAYATSGSAGVDLRAAVGEPIVLEPGKRALVPTGLRIALPEGYEAQIRPRSGLAIKQGITVANAPGTVDSDYRGEVKVGLINLSDAAHTIQRGDRVAQMVVAPVTQVAWQSVGSLDETERGAGGFGSTGS